MALNLRKKIGSEYKILIFDVIQDFLRRFQVEVAGTGQIVVNTGYKAVQAAVMHPILPYISNSSTDNNDILGTSHHDATKFPSSESCLSR